MDGGGCIILELSELVAYAGDKYHIEEQHKWTDFPGFSVLCHPQTGKWIALLMRQWDFDTGTEIQRCDMKCGRESLAMFRRSYLSAPIRMHGNNWIDIAFDERTERDVVFRLLDRAVASGNQHGYTIVLDARPQTGGQDYAYQDTALPRPGRAIRPPEEKIPEQIRKMRRLYEYGRESVESRARNFYRQAVFMQDYEDDCAWTGKFFRYFPTYHDLTARQLRGYFTWRARLRRGDFQPIAASAAYIYIYELLNGIGTKSPEDGLRKLMEFEEGYLDSGIGDIRMRPNLRRWMLEYAILSDLPQEAAVQAADPAITERDLALAALRSPGEHTDKEVFAALCYFGGNKTERSPVIEKDPERGMHLFSEVWRTASADGSQDVDLFERCFGRMQSRRWYPLSNAVYYDQAQTGDRDYELNPCRRYSCRNGIWYVEAFEKLTCDKARVRGLLHETDARLRRYLKTGRYLRENEADIWAVPYIDEVIEADRQALIEAAKPKITIDLSGLDQIRRDALVTQESLLAAEEREESRVPGEEIEKTGGEAEDNIEEAARAGETQPEVNEEPEAAGIQDVTEEPEVPGCLQQDYLPLDHMQIRILRTLLAGQDAAKIISENHLIASVVADAINEALFDEFGDTVVLCGEDGLSDGLSLVEDYTEDLEQYLSDMPEE